MRERSSQKIWIVDHKSGKDLPNQKALEIDDQFGLYTWLAKARGWDVLGTIHDAARTTRNKGDYPDAGPGTKAQTLDQRMLRTPLNRGETELVNIATDAWAVAMHLTVGRTEGLPMYSSPDPQTCSWKCDLKEPHLIARATGRSIQSVLQEYGFEQNFDRH